MKTEWKDKFERPVSYGDFILKPCVAGRSGYIGVFRVSGRTEQKIRLLKMGNSWDKHSKTWLKNRVVPTFMNIDSISGCIKVHPDFLPKLYDLLKDVEISEAPDE